MVTDLPKYMNDVLKFSIKENGFYNALPFLAMWIVAQLTGFLSDFIITKGYMSITNVRKFFTIFGKMFVRFLKVGGESDIIRVETNTTSNINEKCIAVC